MQLGHSGSSFLSALTRSISAEAFVERIEAQSVTGLFTGLLTRKNITDKWGTQSHIDPRPPHACSKGQRGGKIVYQGYGCLRMVNIQVQVWIELLHVFTRHSYCCVFTANEARRYAEQTGCCSSLLLCSYSRLFSFLPAIRDNFAFSSLTFLGSADELYHAAYLLHSAMFLERMKLCLGTETFPGGWGWSFKWNMTLYEISTSGCGAIGK